MDSRQSQKTDDRMEGSYWVEYESVANMKRTWVGFDLPRDWMDSEQVKGHEFFARGHADEEYLAADREVRGDGRGVRAEEY